MLVLVLCVHVNECARVFYNQFSFKAEVLLTVQVITYIKQNIFNYIKFTYEMYMAVYLVIAYLTVI